MGRIYTQEEKRFMYLQQTVHELSGRQTRDHFAAEFPDRPIPSLSTIQKVIHDFNTRGSIDGNSDLPRNVRVPRTLTEDVQVQICAQVEIEPHSTSRGIAKDLEISQHSVLKVLKKDRYKPYKIRGGQVLSENDKQRRYEMAMYMIEELEERDEQYLEKILITDESTFTLDGSRNVQIHRTWARENPFAMVPDNYQYPEKLNVWCGLLDSHVIGPFFIDGNLTANNYLNLLENQVRPAIIAAVGQERASEVIFQQDGAGPHRAIRVRNYLNANFDRWIGMYSTYMEWAPRSPCLTCCDFFLWGYVKQKLYKFERIETLDQLRDQITNIIGNLTPEVIRKVAVTEFEARLRCCIAAEGDIFEYCYR